MFRHWKQFLFEEDKGDKGGGGGGASELETLKTQYAELAKKFEALDKSKETPKPDDTDLAAKAKLQREENEKKTLDGKRLEAAIRFTVGAGDWLKTNETLLPKGINSIFEMAEKETYDNPIQKDSAIKAGLIQEFFALQANVDLLTPSQKSGLEEFLKLTKNAKEERAQQMYDTVFEPTFEMLKRVKKAEQLASGVREPDNLEAAYKERLMSGSKKHYLGAK